jgi:hypothetical protein
MSKFPVTMQDLKKAQRAYKKQEPRDVAYRAAIALVDLAVRKKVELTTGEALAVLLQSWNMSYYRYHGGFNAKHFGEIERLLTRHNGSLISYRQRSLEGFNAIDEGEVKKVFKNFELVLGPVGAAKGLHLLAPRFFPLWDRTIAQKHGCSMWPRGFNGDRYCRFMMIAKEQIKSLGGAETVERVMGRNALKALDEHHYCKAMGWT